MRLRHIDPGDANAFSAGQPERVAISDVAHPCHFTRGGGDQLQR